MTRRSADEIKKHNLPIEIPYYRFTITQSGKSDQHELLLALDDGSNLVFYAAPRFHQFDEINFTWKSNSVATQSIFVAPSVIGTLDAQTHRVAFDKSNAWLCSNPKPIPLIESDTLVAKRIARIAADGAHFEISFLISCTICKRRKREQKFEFLKEKVPLQGHLEASLIGLSCELRHETAQFRCAHDASCLSQKAFCGMRPTLQRDYLMRR